MKNFILFVLISLLMLFSSCNKKEVVDRSKETDQASKTFEGITAADIDSLVRSLGIDILPRDHVLSNYFSQEDLIRYFYEIFLEKVEDGSVEIWARKTEVMLREKQSAAGISSTTFLEKVQFAGCDSERDSVFAVFRYVDQENKNTSNPKEENEILSFLNQHNAFSYYDEYKLDK